MPFKLTAEDAFTALVSSEESWPQIASDSCVICVITVSSPANIFMARVLREELICNRGAYSGTKTILWSAASFEGCDVTISDYLIDAWGMTWQL